MKFNTRIIYRLLCLIIGLTVHATGSSILREAQLSVDPFTSFTLGLSSTFHIELGLIHILVNGFFLALCFSKTSIRHWRWDLTRHGFNWFPNSIHFTTAQTTPSITKPLGDGSGSNYRCSNVFTWYQL